MSSTDSSEFRSTARSASVIGITAFVGALIGFVLQLLVAYHFGASGKTDAFFMAQSASELLSKLLLGGSITAVFIPLFISQITHKGKDDAWRMALNLFHLMIVVYVLFIGGLALFADPFTQFIAPGFDDDTRALTVSLLRILLPSFFFLFLVEFTTSILQSLKQFALPALLRLVAPTISIIFIATLVSRIGIYALALGVVVGSIIQFGILAWGLKKEGLTYSFVFHPKDPVIRKVIRLVYPFIFSVLTTQAAGIVYRILVSDLSAGSLASLKFAEKITQLAAIMFLNSVTMVIYPTLSEKASKQDAQGMQQTIGSAVRLIVFVTVPIVIGVALLRVPLIQVLYERGSFSATDTAMTSIALLFLIIGLTTNGISSIFGHAVLAFQKTKAAVGITAASQFIAISLFVLLVPRMAHAGLALASSLVPVASAILYFIYLRRKIPKLYQVFSHNTFVKTGILAILLFFVVLITRNMLASTPPITQVLLPSLAGAAAFFGGATLLHVHEMKEVIAIARERFKLGGKS